MDHSTDRRRFLLSGLGAAAFTTPALSLLNACKTTSRPEMNQTSLAGETALTGLTIRKSAIDPSNKNNIELYRKAVAAMKATTFPIKRDGRDITWWEAHAYIHDGYCPHGNWFFLPWHRGYLHYFEKVCREFCGDPSFALPYWDWTADSSLPDAFTDGDEKSNALNNATRNIKPREALNLRETSAENIQKIMDISDFHTFAGGASHRPKAIDRSIENEQNGYTGRLEAGPHNKVHATMGGDMGTFISPKDPIFWLHHCNVDRLWTIWAAKRTEAKQPIMPYDFDEEAVKPEPKPANLLDGGDWLKMKIGGYYKIEKVANTFKAIPAELTIKEVYDAIQMGLAYQPYVKPAESVSAEPETTKSPVQEPVATTPTTQAPAAATPTTQAPAATTPTTQAPAATTPTTQAPVAPETELPIATAPTESEKAAQKSVAAEAVTSMGIDSATGLPKFIPTPITPGMMKSRWKSIIKNQIIAKSNFISSFSLVASSQNSAKIKNSPELKAAIKKALVKRNVRGSEATLRMILKGIPFPSNPKAELHLYLNATNVSGENANPNYIGSVCFFGHNHHDAATMSAAFDILPTIRKIKDLQSTAFESEENIVLTAVWKSTTQYDDLSGLNFSLDYLEMEIE